jgi:imidazolonepropionase-like amidohydrolase
VVGSIVAGKQADLLVIDGDPSARIDDVRKGTLVFKQGVGYDRRSLLPRFGVASDCSDVDAITR